MYLRAVLFEIELKTQEVIATQESEEPGDKAEKVPEDDAKALKKLDAGRASPDVEMKNVLLKGQMMYIEDMNAIMYLCSPM